MSVVCAFDPCHGRIVQSNMYIPPLGAVKIPVDAVYPYPWFETTVLNTTRPLTARFLIDVPTRTLKPQTRSSKIKVMCMEILVNVIV